MSRPELLILGGVVAGVVTAMRHEFKRV